MINIASVLVPFTSDISEIIRFNSTSLYHIISMQQYLAAGGIVTSTSLILPSLLSSLSLPLSLSLHPSLRINQVLEVNLPGDPSNSFTATPPGYRVPNMHSDCQSECMFMPNMPSDCQSECMFMPR